MTHTDKKTKATDEEILLNDFIKLLGNLERIYKINSSEKTPIVYFVKKLKNTLRPYKHVRGNEFLELVKNSLFWEPQIFPKKKNKITKKIPQIIPTKSYDEIREILAEDNIMKDELLNIAEKQFGLSKGTLQRLRKNEIKAKIEGAIQNMETLKAIQRKAVE